MDLESINIDREEDVLASASTNATSAIMKEGTVEENPVEKEVARAELAHEIKKAELETDPTLAISKEDFDKLSPASQLFATGINPESEWKAPTKDQLLEVNRNTPEGDVFSEIQNQIFAYEKSEGRTGNIFVQFIGRDIIISFAETSTGRKVVSTFTIDAALEALATGPKELSEFVHKNIMELFYQQADEDIVAATASASQDVSDGYHTFRELYKHRNALFIALCHFILKNHGHQEGYKVLKSQLHDDGTMFPNMFILQLTTPEGQVSYHLDMDLWNSVNVPTYANADKYDGHTPEEAIQRLLFMV